MGTGVLRIGCTGSIHGPDDGQRSRSHLAVGLDGGRPGTAGPPAGRGGGRGDGSARSEGGMTPGQRELRLARAYLNRVAEPLAAALSELITAETAIGRRPSCPQSPRSGAHSDPRHQGTSSRSASLIYLHLRRTTRCTWGRRDGPGAGHVASTSSAGRPCCGEDLRGPAESARHELSTGLRGALAHHSDAELAPSACGRRLVHTCPVVHRPACAMSTALLRCDRFTT